MKRYFVIKTILISICLISLGYNYRSYGSSHLESKDEKNTIQFIEENQDCIVWKFHLLTRIYGVVEQIARRKILDMKKRHLTTENFMYDIPIRINMNKVLPPETAKKIIDTIIEREGGHCAKEVLYDIKPCFYTISGRLVYGSPSANISFDYFSKSTNIPISKDLVFYYDDLLKRHLSKSPQPIDRIDNISDGKMKCLDNCDNNIFSFYYSNGSAHCMIEKHQEYITDHVVDHFDDLFSNTKHSDPTVLDTPSMESFIEESDNIAEQYKNKPPQNSP